MGGSDILEFPALPGQTSGSTIHWLCDPALDVSPLWASIFSRGKCGRCWSLPLMGVLRSQGTSFMVRLVNTERTLNKVNSGDFYCSVTLAQGHVGTADMQGQITL